MSRIERSELAARPERKQTGIRRVVPAHRCAELRIVLLPRPKLDEVVCRHRGQGRALVDDNDYSVPVHYAHLRLTVVATVSEVRLVFDDRLAAKHVRCWEREQTFFEPIHYLALMLGRKPGGFDYAKPLEQSNLPECWALLRRRLEAHDPKHGTRSFRFKLPPGPLPIQTPSSPEPSFTIPDTPRRHFHPDNATIFNRA